MKYNDIPFSNDINSQLKTQVKMINDTCKLNNTVICVLFVRFLLEQETQTEMLSIECHASMKLDVRK